jgi:formamidopyrimidine-DNA glycosylase
MVDPRHFATVKIFTEDGNSELEKKLATLGPDLVQYFSSAHPSDEEEFIGDFMRICRKNNSKNICVVLMEQKNFSGIGNYLKSEILDDARIHPLCSVEQLDDSRLMTLYESMKRIIRTSIKANGTKISSYSDMLMPPEDAIYEFNVYQRKTTTNGEKILKTTTPDKRTTFYRESIKEC